MAIDAIKAEVAAKNVVALEAAKAEEDRIAKLNAAKAICFEACGPISEAVAQATDPREKNLLVELEQRTHANHQDMITKAYQEFTGELTSTTNAAQPGVITPIESNIAVLNDASVTPVADQA